MIKIYLDWNVITTLRQIETLVNADDKETFETLLNIVVSAKEKIAIPYSNGHLKDLMKSYKKGERQRVEEALKFISFLSQDLCITQYWNEENVKWHNQNPEEFFQSLLDESEESTSLTTGFESLKEYGLDKVFDLYKLIPHNINIEQVEQHSPVFASFLKKAKIENSMYALMEDLFGLINNMKANPQAYNDLRSVFTTSMPLDPNIHNISNVIEMLDTTMPKTMLKKSFTDLYEQNNKTETFKNKDYSKITGTFMQLDFVGYGSDKLTDKNQYDNLTNDALHCFYGAHCHFFITSDKKTYKKTKAVYQSENIATQVMKPKEFIEFLKQAANP